jgi:hypothetical protein
MVAHLRRHGRVLELEGFEPVAQFPDFDALLSRAGPWIGGFDLPFGLPREFVRSQGWPMQWDACMSVYAGITRAELRERFRAFCDARPAGSKFAHRRTDGPAGASPSMKWVNPPVAWMMHAGVPRLRAAGVLMPGLQPGDPSRVAVEAYPGMIARAITRSSYKTDTAARADQSRLDARTRVLDVVVAGGHPEGSRLKIRPQGRREILDDFRADRLDALLCGLQAAWCLQRIERGFGVPAGLDPLEGWIAGAE